MTQTIATLPCPKCGPLFGPKTYSVREVGPHTGAYCLECGAWMKWLPKQRQGGAA